MKIVPTQVFLDEGKRLLPKRVYEVSTWKRQYFKQYGWARDATPKDLRWWRKVRKHG